MKNTALLPLRTNYLKIKFELFTRYGLRYILSPDDCGSTAEKIYYGEITYLPLEEVRGIGGGWKIFVPLDGSPSDTAAFGECRRRLGGTDTEFVPLPVQDGNIILELFGTACKIPLYPADLTRYKAPAYSVTGLDITKNYLRKCEADFRLVNTDGSTPELADFDNGVCSARNGTRTVCHKTGVYRNKIHVIGECESLGYGNGDAFTWTSRLQKYINEELPGSYEVVNHAVHHTRELFQPLCLRFIENANLREGDLVILTEDRDFEKSGMFKSLCARHGAGFLFVIFPEYQNKPLTENEKFLISAAVLHPRFTPDYTVTQEMAYTAAALDIPYIDLNPLLLRETEHFFIDHIHLGSNGQDWTARSIMKFLTPYSRRGL